MPSNNFSFVCLPASPYFTEAIGVGSTLLAGLKNDNLLIMAEQPIEAAFLPGRYFPNCESIIVTGAGRYQGTIINTLEYVLQVIPSIGARHGLDDPQAISRQHDRPLLAVNVPGIDCGNKHVTHLGGAAVVAVFKLLYPDLEWGHGEKTLYILTFCRNEALDFILGENTAAIMSQLQRQLMKWGYNRVVTSRNVVECWNKAFGDSIPEQPQFIAVSSIEGLFASECGRPLAVPVVPAIHMTSSPSIRDDEDEEVEETTPPAAVQNHEKMPAVPSTPLASDDDETARPPKEPKRRKVTDIAPTETIPVNEAADPILNKAIRYFHLPMLVKDNSGIQAAALVDDKGAFHVAIGLVATALIGSGAQLDVSNGLLTGLTDDVIKALSSSTITIEDRFAMQSKAFDVREAVCEALGGGGQPTTMGCWLEAIMRTCTRADLGGYTLTVSHKNHPHREYDAKHIIDQNTDITPIMVSHQKRE